MRARIRTSAPSSARRRRRRRPEWADWPDDRLLDLRLCDLGLSLAGSPVEPIIRRVQQDLERHDIRFRPHFWLSEEWFSPDGIPGVAVPFFLAHPRLTRLERRQMLEVEGGTRESCLRILRHEAGHALDHAYLLHRRRKWQRLFGKSSQPYPEFYRPRPYSRNYVVHLDYWYAQSHPDEDFAETFAVWLGPRTVWQRRYQGWPALAKIEYVDELMRQIAGTPPLVRSRERIEPLNEIRKTLRQYYAEKRAHYAGEFPRFYDDDLRALFSDRPEHAGRESAAAFLRRVRGEIRRMVSRWTGQYEYTLDQVLKGMIARCRELQLHVAGSERRIKMDFAILLTVQTMNHLYSARHQLAM
ncbi:MAG: hypothetical protein AMXMBFR83_20350 [Phycisphaerae bacterium]